ncbi:MAG: hypothetical protein KDI51_18915 [Xanthomonadales bacterium]|nr:hypothetical protein [Xanthomonadales bacterium]
MERILLLRVAMLSFLMSSCRSNGLERGEFACLRSEEVKGLALDRSKLMLEEASGVEDLSRYSSTLIWVKRFIVVEWWPDSVKANAWEFVFDCSGAFVRQRELPSDATQSFQDPS